jgi:hypothetical protein
MRINKIIFILLSIAVLIVFVPFLYSYLFTVSIDGGQNSLARENFIKILNQTPGTFYHDTGCKDLYAHIYFIDTDNGYLDIVICESIYAGSCFESATYPFTIKDNKILVQTKFRKPSQINLEACPDYIVPESINYTFEYKSIFGVKKRQLTLENFQSNAKGIQDEKFMFENKFKN